MVKKKENCKRRERDSKQRRNGLRFIADKGMKNISREKQMNKDKVMYVVVLYLICVQAGRDISPLYVAYAQSWPSVLLKSTCLRQHYLLSKSQ
jgi:hypothetical protein